MTIEDRLRTALNAAGPGPVPNDDAWTAITSRAVRRSRRKLLRRVTAIVAPLAAAAGLGIGLAYALTPSGPPPVQVHVTRGPAAAFARVDWAVVAAAPDASNCAVTATPQVAYVLSSAGPLAVVASNCQTGSGPPPTGLFVYDNPTAGPTPRLRQVLLSPSLDDLADRPFNVVRTAITLQVGVHGPLDGQCCPDHHMILTWRWNGARYRQTGASILPPAIAVAGRATRTGPGGAITYNLTITNYTDATLTYFQILTSATSPDSGLQWVRGTLGCQAPRFGGSTCGVVTLPPGATITVSFTERPTRAAVPTVAVDVSANLPPGAKDPYNGSDAGDTLTTGINIAAPS